MAFFRLILVAYFVARCAASSMGMLPTRMLDDAFAEQANSARMQRNCYLCQSEGTADDEDEVAMIEIDDDFVPALASEPSFAICRNGAAPVALEAPPYVIFLDGVFRPPQENA